MMRPLRALEGTTTSSLLVRALRTLTDASSRRVRPPRKTTFAAWSRPLPPSRTEPPRTSRVREAQARSAEDTHFTARNFGAPGTATPPLPVGAPWAAPAATSIDTTDMAVARAYACVKTVQTLSIVPPGLADGLAVRTSQRYGHSRPIRPNSWFPRTASAGRKRIRLTKWTRRRYQPITRKGSPGSCEKARGGGPERK